MNRSLFLCALFILLISFSDCVADEISSHTKEIFSLITKQSGMALDVRGSKKEDGSEVILYPFKGSPNEQFTLKPAREKGFYYLVNENSKKCIAIGSKGSLVINTETDSNSQKWQFIPQKDDCFIIVSKEKGMALDTTEATEKSKPRIVFAAQSGAESQLWQFRTIQKLVDPAQKALDDALLKACQEGDIATVKQLLDKGADPNTRDKYNNGPVFYASWMQDKKKDVLGLLKLLAARGARLGDSFTLDNRSLLHDQYQPEVIKYLLALGLDANAKTKVGTTPLLEHIIDPELVKLFISHGADLNVRNQAGETPLGKLLLASLADADHLAVLTMLLDKGANAEDVDAYHNTALMFPREVEIIKICLAKYPGLLNRQNALGQTPLMACARLNNFTFRVATLLLKQGAKLELRDNKGRTVLMYASRWANNNLLKVLLKQGANTNAQDDAGNTALHYALLEFGNEETVQLLLDAGASAVIENKAGRTALDLALERSDPDVASLVGLHGGRGGFSGGLETKANDFGGRTEVTLHEDNQQSDGIAKVTNEYGFSDIWITSSSENLELLRRRTTLYHDASAAATGIRKKIDLFTSEQGYWPSKKGLIYGKLRETRLYYTPEFSSKNGYRVKTVYFDSFLMAITETLCYTEQYTSKTGFIRKSVFGKSKEDNWRFMPSKVPAIATRYGERIYTTNEFSGMTTATMFLKGCYFYDWCGLKQLEYARDKAGVLRLGKVLYNEDDQQRNRQWQDITSVIDRYDSSGMMEREEIEYRSNHPYFRAREIKEYKNQHLYQQTILYIPELIKKENAGKAADIRLPDKIIIAYTIDRTNGSILKKISNYEAGKLVGTENESDRDVGHISQEAEHLSKYFIEPHFRALHAPVSTSFDPDALARYLTFNMRNDYEKFAAVFYWVNTNMTYDEILYYKKINRVWNAGWGEQTQYPLYRLYQKLAICENYSELFQLLAEKAGNPMSVIYASGEVDNLPIGHAWNIVYINGEYHHIDCTWGLLFFIPKASERKLREEWRNRFNDYQWNLWESNIKN